jgi:abortive infection bacteriophage resistance protein
VSLCDPERAFFYVGVFMDVKEPKTFDEQLSILKSRGCICNDEKCCKEFLKKVNYYSFTAYFLPYKTKEGNYVAGTSFESIRHLYNFDRKLRSQIFPIVEEIEIFLRTQLAYFHSHKYGSLGYTNAASFNDDHDEQKLKDMIIDIENNNKKSLIIKHHKEKYDGKYPLWVIIEFFSTGMISHFYADLKTADKKSFCLNAYHNKNLCYDMVSWLRCLTDLRNKCAHYGRLYYFKFPTSPSFNEKYNFPMNRVFAYLVVLKNLYPNKENWNSTFVLGLEALIEEYSDYIYLYHLGFPANWKDIIMN